MINSTQSYNKLQSSPQLAISMGSIQTNSLGFGNNTNINNSNSNNYNYNNYNGYNVSKMGNTGISPRVQLIKHIENGSHICECVDGVVPNRSINGQVVIYNKQTNKIVYEGQFFNSVRCGYGIEYSEDGTILYEGQFVGGVRDGWGRTPQYQGQFKQGQFDGWGRFCTPQIIYEGYFVQGLYNGIGILIQSKTPSFKNQQVLSRQSKLQQFLLDQMSKNPRTFFTTYNIDHVYIGQWTKGLKNGSGKIWRENGYWYNGQFSYDSMHGTGAQFIQGQGVVKGLYVKGKFVKKW